MRGSQRNDDVIYICIVYIDYMYIHMYQTRLYTRLYTRLILQSFLCISCVSGNPISCIITLLCYTRNQTIYLHLT